MDDTPREQLEKQIKAACDADDYEQGVTLLLRGYGQEILGYLIARQRGEGDGSEAFSMFAEDVWKGLPGFEFRCTVRGWAYMVARRAAYRLLRAPHRRHEQHMTFSKHPSLEEELVAVRTRTAAHMRTEVKDQFQLLREQLSEADQALLILRVDRQLPWRELAMVMQGEEEQLSDDELDKSATMLRQRFTAVKKRLRTLAEKEGLISPSAGNDA